MSDFKPMLSGKAPDDLSKLIYPLLASPKLDGIRCVINEDGTPVSRKLLQIPNDYVRAQLAGLPPGLDGELLLADPTALFRKVSSAIMSKGGEPDFRYAVFDWFGVQEGFSRRLSAVREEFMPPRNHPRVYVVQHQIIPGVEELQELHRNWTEIGYEGTMVRSPDGPYKFGRSTVREGYLLKIKPSADEDAVVIGVEEQMHNTNKAEKDNLGRTKRSSAKAGKVGKGTLGKIICRFEDGTEFKCGTGFDDLQRMQIWEEKDNRFLTVLGKIAKIKHQPDPDGRQPGQKPRIPVFLGWRKD